METSKATPETSGTFTMVREWVAKDGDAEKTARWMARTLRIGSLPECRRLVSAALGR